MIVLAGCSNTTTVERTDHQPVTSQPETSTPTPTTQQPAIERVGDSPAQGLNLSQYSDQLGPGSAGLNRTEQQRVQAFITGFYDSVDNESDRRQTILNSSERVCRFDANYTSKLKPSMLKEGGTTTKHAVRRAHFAAQIVHEFDGEAPVKIFGDTRAVTGDVTKYAPLIGSYNRMVDTACAAAQQRTNATIAEYKVATLMFGVDAMLVSTGAFYKPAFAGTRFVTNKASQLGLYRLRYVCGNRCWALGMSEVHVGLRSGMLTTTSSVLRRSAEMGINLTRNDVEAVAAAQNLSTNRLLANSNVTLQNGTVQSVSEDVIQCGTKAVNATQQTDTAESGSSDDGGLLGGDGIDTGDVVNGTKDAVNQTRKFVDECRDDTG
ncbi:hypothetical protein ACFQL4_11095 [Halosimplex aquaticum]